ncbi:hypothetical protein F183_A02760 [Bryobacterales bacterium F-183]|nr:hypothetical protein F183_A02760 [Bryobacterales bacterium F-183]
MRNRLLSGYLIGTGVLAVIAVLAPSLIVIGFFLGILPGILLQLAPSAFLYGVVFALLQHALTSTSLRPPIRNTAALLATPLFFWLLPQPGLWRAEALLNNTFRPDITPPAESPVQLSGHVLIEDPSAASRCGALCAAILSTPGVTAVTVQSPPAAKRKKPATTFRFVPASDPGEPVTPSAFGFEKVGRDVLGGSRALEAQWNLRLAKGIKLIASVQQPPPPPTDFVLELREEQLQPDAPTSRWSLLPGKGKLSVATIRDRGQRVLLRRQAAALAAPAAPLLSEFTGSPENGQLGWRTRVFSYPPSSPRPSSASLNLDTLALAHTNVARGVDQDAAIRQARSELAAALADPSRPPGDPGLLLANAWMGSFQGRGDMMSIEDAALVERIVLDPRISKAQGLRSAVAAMGRRESERLRRPAEARLLRDPKAAEEWVSALRQLPRGAFAVQTPEEKTILSNPAFSRYAPAVIERQADRGKDALPDLLRLLEEHATADPGKNGYAYASQAIDAVRRALQELGPTAAPILPKVEELFQRHDRLRRARDMDWDATLVAMGMSPERASKPASMSGSNGRYARAVEARARRRQQRGARIE